MARSGLTSYFEVDSLLLHHTSSSVPGSTITVTGRGVGIFYLMVTPSVIFHICLRTGLEECLVRSKEADREEVIALYDRDEFLFASYCIIAAEL